MQIIGSTQWRAYTPNYCGRLWRETRGEGGNGEHGPSLSVCSHLFKPTLFFFLFFFLHFLFFNVDCHLVLFYGHFHLSSIVTCLFLSLLFALLSSLHSLAFSLSFSLCVCLHLSLSLSLSFSLSFSLCVCLHLLLSVSLSHTHTITHLCQ